MMVINCLLNIHLNVVPPSFPFTWLGSSISRICLCLRALRSWVLSNFFFSWQCHLEGMYGAIKKTCTFQSFQSTLVLIPSHFLFIFTAMRSLLPWRHGSNCPPLPFSLRPSPVASGCDYDKELILLSLTKSEFKKLSLCWMCSMILNLLKCC